MELASKRRSYHPQEYLSQLLQDQKELSENQWQMQKQQRRRNDFPKVLFFIHDKSFLISPRPLTRKKFASYSLSLIVPFELLLERERYMTVHSSLSRQPV